MFIFYCLVKKLQIVQTQTKNQQPSGLDRWVPMWVILGVILGLVILGVVSHDVPLLIELVIFRNLCGDHLLRSVQKVKPGFPRIDTPNCDATPFPPVRSKLHVAIHVINVLPDGIERSVWVVRHGPGDVTIDLLSVRIVHGSFCARVVMRLSRIRDLRGNTLSSSLFSCAFSLAFAFRSS